MYAVWAIGGFCIGSFLNVLIDRIPIGKSIMWGRSACDHCKKQLRWFELIPLASYLIQGGRCRRCKGALSLQYPLVEVSTAVGYVSLMWYFRDYSWTTQVAWLIAFSSFLVIFVIDLKHQIIPDVMVGVLGLLGLVLIAPLPQVEWLPHLVSGFLAGLFFLVLWLITRGRGMGFGDVKLAAVMGLLLGYPHIVVALYAAFLTGAIVAVILIARGKARMKSKIAFGPFLIVGTFIGLVWTDMVVKIWFPFL